MLYPCSHGYGRLYISHIMFFEPKHHIIISSSTFYFYQSPIPQETSNLWRAFTQPVTIIILTFNTTKPSTSIRYFSLFHWTVAQATVSTTQRDFTHVVRHRHTLPAWLRLLSAKFNFNRSLNQINAISSHTLCSSSRCLNSQNTSEAKKLRCYSSSQYNIIVSPLRGNR